jgi:hypothetical protein
MTKIANVSDIAFGSESHSEALVFESIVDGNFRLESFQRCKLMKCSKDAFLI